MNKEEIFEALDHVLEILKDVPASYDASKRDETKRILETCSLFEKAWSGAVFGYMAHTYIRDFRPKRPGDHWDSEWGTMGYFSNQTQGEWDEFEFKYVVDEIFRRAEVDQDEYEKDGKAFNEAFERAQYELRFISDSLVVNFPDSLVCELAEKTQELKGFITRRGYAESRTQSYITAGMQMRDMRAVQGRPQTPAHIWCQGIVAEMISKENQVGEMQTLVERLQRLVKSSGANLNGEVMAGTKVFIGHGRSGVWKDLRYFLDKTLELNVDEFNSSSAAGMATIERLEEMLGSACFAFLIMTAEDVHEDGTAHARENVIHEAGLFQGRLGFRRAIVLLEEGCEEFSNIHGLTQIRFSKGNIRSCYEDVREVLKREGLV